MWTKGCWIRYESVSYTHLKKVGADDETIARLKAEGGIRLGDDIVPEEDRAPVAPVE